MQRAIPAACALIALLAACTAKQAVQSRKHAIEHTKGAEVSGGGFERPIEHIGQIRVYASRDFQEQRSDWRIRIKKMVASADDILGPAFAVQLQVVDTQGWNPTCNPADLAACLEELVAYDSGDDVDWVVGLVAALPRFTVSYDELGMARMPGRHFVLRDLYDVAERQAIDDLFPAMTPSKKSEIYRERERHKRLVTFLHEWGHTMGAPHVRREEMILYPQYNSEAATFSEENLRLIDASLKDRFPFDPAYPALTKHLTETTSEEWWPGEREYLLSTLGVAATYAPQPAPAAQMTVSGEDDALLAGVSEQDRARYADAKTKLEAGKAEASWAALAPLIDRYPDSYPIQHFGCSLAMQVGEREKAGVACRRAIELVGNP